MTFPAKFRIATVNGRQLRAIEMKEDRLTLRTSGAANANGGTFKSRSEWFRRTTIARSKAAVKKYRAAKRKIALVNSRTIQRKYLAFVQGAVSQKFLPEAETQSQQ
jgi:hypothetical protein